MKYFLIAIVLFLQFGCKDERLKFEAGESELIQNGVLLDSNVNTTFESDDPEVFDIRIYERQENKDLTISLGFSNIPLVKNNDIALFSILSHPPSVRLNSLSEMGGAVVFRYKIWKGYPEHSFQIKEVSNNKRQVAGAFKLSFIGENTPSPDTTFVEGSFDVKVRS